MFWYFIAALIIAFVIALIGIILHYHIKFENISFTCGQGTQTHLTISYFIPRRSDNQLHQPRREQGRLHQHPHKPCPKKQN
jgi:hypothetical protein